MTVCTCCGVYYRSYAAYQNTVEFNWLFLKYITDMMPFHDCSTLSSSSSGSLESYTSLSTFSDYAFDYDLPALSSPAGL